MNKQDKNFSFNTLTKSNQVKADLIGLSVKGGLLTCGGAIIVTL